MRHNKLKKLVLLAVILCINSIPVVTYAKDTKIKEEITQQSNKDTKIKEEITQQSNNDTTIKEGTTKQSNIKIEDNWLTREIAIGLNKKVENLTEQDFLIVKKFELKDKSISGEIPQEVRLLKNLESLTLNNCQIDGQVPDYLGELPKLTHLDLGNNKLEKLPDNIKQKIIKQSYTYCDVEGNNFKLDEGWYFLKGKRCYLDTNGSRIKGNKTINGKEYEFSDDGNLKDGWQKDKNNNFYFYDGLNGIVKSQLKQISGAWYYFNKDGLMLRGMQNVNGSKFYLNDSGAMVTGWQKIENAWYYFSNAGSMQYGWLTVDDKTYYIDPSTGIMVTGDQTINGTKYRFSSDGSFATNTWIDNYTYVQPNGTAVNTYGSYSHSNTNYQLFKYMTNENNQLSVDSTAIALHGGVTSNNCVYFTSEALRRVGVSIPQSTANTYQLENQLKSLGFAYSYDFSQIKPGDIVFTNGYTHVYTFMCWDKDGYAYIVDNQRTSFDNKVLHKRKILQDTATTDRATHFFYSN